MDESKVCLEMMEQAAQGLLVLQGDQVVYANPAAAGLLGWPDTAALKGKGQADLLAAGGWLDQLRQRLAAAAPADGLPPQTVTGKHAAGYAISLEAGARWLELNGAPALQVSFHKAGVSPQALRNRYQGILAAVPDIIMEVDQTRIYTWANQAGLDFFGAEVLGREAAYYFVGEQTTYQQVQPLFSGDEDTFYVESWQRRQDGQSRLLAWWCRALKAPDGAVTGAISAGRDITDLRADQAALAESRQFLQTVLDTIPARVFWKDRQLRYLGCNLPFAQDAGLSAPEELLDRDDYEMGWREQAELYRADDQAVIDSGQAKLQFEEPQTTPRGDQIWLRTSKSPLRNARGETIGVLGTYEDITAEKTAVESLVKAYNTLEDANRKLREEIQQREQAEAALRESEARWQFALEGAGDGVWDWNVATNEVFFSNRWKEMLGYAGDEIGNRLDEWQQRVHPDDLEYTLGEISKHFDGLTALYSSEHRLRCKDGSYKWILDRGKVLTRDAAGQPLRVIGIHTDITERKLAEDALLNAYDSLEETNRQLEEEIEERQRVEREIAASELRLRFLLDAAPYGAHEYELLPDGRLVFLGANAAAERILQFDHTSLYGLTIEEAFPGLLGTEIPEAYRDVARSGKAYSQEQVVYDREQLTGCFDIVAVQTRAQRMAVFFRDITERRRAEEAMQAAYASLGDINLQLEEEVEERRRVEQALQAATDQWEATFDSVNDAVWVLNLDLRIVQANQASFRMFGLAPEQILGRHCWEVMHGANSPLEQCPVVLMQQSRRREVLQLRVNGNYYHVSADPMFDTAGRLTGAVHTVSDITERQRNEDQRRFEEIRLEALLTLHRMAGSSEQEITHFAMEEAVRLTNSTIGYLAFTNEDETVLNMYAWSKQAMAECAIQDKPIVYQVADTGLWGEAIRQRQPVITNDYQGPLLQKKGYPAGHVHITRHMNVPVFDGDRIVIVAGAGNKTEPYDEADVRQLQLLMEGMWQIIQRRRFERDLAEEKERLAVTLRSIGDAVITTDELGRITMLNRMAEYLTGWLQPEALGRPLTDVFRAVHEQTREPVDNPVERALAGGKAEGLAARAMLIARDGTSRLVADSSAPIRDRHSRLVGVVLVFRDVTAELKMREELERSSKLETVGMLAGRIAHDFNNLLAAIAGNVSIAQAETAGDNRLSAHLADAERACFRARDLTQQLLTFATGGAPQMKLIQVDGVVGEAVRFALSGSRHTCRIEIVPEVWSASLDEAQISQVIHNLVLNADQAMPQPDEVQVRVDNYLVSQHDPLPLAPGPYIRVAVQDHGVGIPPSQLGKIFDPFFTTKQRGSGLGLASAYSIVHAHAGWIEVQSALGQGSTFTVYLPARPGVQPQVEAQATAQALPHVRVLVLDDEEMVGRMLAEMLKRMGHQVEVVLNGSAALQAYARALAEGRPFELLILDLTVPGSLGGREVLAELRKEHPAIQAIATSGYSTDPVMANFSEFGFSGRLAKPYHRAELCSVLREVLLGQR